ncbi:MAG: HD domain-containing phosphohydrolase [Candidatus Firestonebacteria bacterium]
MTAYKEAILVLFLCATLLTISFISYRRHKKAEKNQLVNRIRDMVENLKTINQINELILSSSNMIDVLNIVVEDISKVIKDIGIIIFLLNDDKNKLSPVVISNNLKTTVKVLGVVHDLESVEILKSIIDKKTVEIDSSKMLIPILRKDVTIGAICIVNLSGQKKFTDEEKRYLETFTSQISIILENKRHLESEKFHKEEMMCLNSIMEVGLLSLTLDETLEVLMNRFVSITKANSGVILLRDPHRLEFLLKIKSGFKLEKDEEILNENKDIIEETIKGNNRIIKDKKISLPLISRSKIVNCIILLYYKEEINEKKVKFLENLVEKASIVIERAQVYESTLEMVKNQSSISYLGNVILSTVDLDTVLNLIVRSITEILWAKGTVLKLLNETEQKLELYASYGLSSNYLIDIENLLNDIENKAVKMQQLLTIEDISTYNHSHLEKINSLICVPLIVKNKIVGVLTIFSPYKRIFSEDEKKLTLIFASHTAIAIENARLLKQSKTMYMNIIKSLATILDTKDNYTRDHSEEVTKYAIEIAVEIGLTEEEKELLQFSAILHDIGKIGIEDNILKKPSKLTPSEYEVVKKHPVIAANILEKISEFKDVANIIAHHHERYNGKGYPDGLKEQSIPLLSRIITVVDAFEAMISDRPYRKAIDENTALNELELNKFTQFDPLIVDVFKKVLLKKKIL